MMDNRNMSAASAVQATALLALKRQSRLAMAAILLLGGTACAWSLTAVINGAVISSGTLVVESNVKRIQHPTGGVVGAIRIADGQQVRAGDLLLSLDDTVTRANLAIIINDLTAFRARLARLRSERDNARQIAFPEDLTARSNHDGESRQILSGETALFEARRLMRQGQRAQMIERIEQFKLERQSLLDQQKSLSQQRDIARSELADMEGLLKKNLIQRPRVTQLQREVIRIEGSIAEAASRMAQTAGKVAESELALLQLDRDAMTENAKDTRETETRIVELNERRIAAQDQLARVDIRSPQDGFVHQLSAHTLGGVIAAGETIMQIVPLSDTLVIEARIAPTDIDQIVPDQVAFLRMSAFSSRTTPELNGHLARISPELNKDPQTGQTYYTATIKLDEGELAKLKGLKLIPGMPVEAHLATSSRTIASFLTKPLSDQFRRALRDE